MHQSNNVKENSSVSKMIELREITQTKTVNPLELYNKRHIQNEQKSNKTLSLE